MFEDGTDCDEIDSGGDACVGGGEAFFCLFKGFIFDGEVFVCLFEGFVCDGVAGVEVCFCGERWGGGSEGSGHSERFERTSNLLDQAGDFTDFLVNLLVLLFEFCIDFWIFVPECIYWILKYTYVTSTRLRIFTCLFCF